MPRVIRGLDWMVNKNEGEWVSERCFPASLSHATPYRSTPKSFWTTTTTRDDAIIVITSTASEHSFVRLIVSHIFLPPMDAKCEPHFSGFHSTPSCSSAILCASSDDDFFFPARRFSVLQRDALA